MRIFMHTFGCKVNQYDTEALAHLLRERGHAVVEDPSGVDLVIVNTCAVTSESERKARQYLRKTAKEHPGAILVVTGCYGQTSPEAFSDLEAVKLVTGVKDRQLLAEQIDGLSAAADTAVRVDQWSSQETMEWNGAEFPSRTRAFLKIEDGCSAQCSYCKIPSARGPVRSLPLEQVVKEAEHLINLDHREVVLAGIHLGSYGRDLGVGLDEVVRRVDALPGEFRFRLGSVEPNDFTPGLIEAIEKARHLCPHLHIPLQSGSLSVLRRMNRHYSPEEFAGLLARLRKALPDLAVTTDVIVGFPGESKDEFEETIYFLTGQQFSGLHVFPFSRRAGTAAYDMPDQLSRQVKQERVSHLIKLAEKLTLGYQQQFLGRKVQVLIEEPVSGGGEGFSEHYIRTRVMGRVEAGELVSAEVTGFSGEILIAAV